jgi:hypothetical protein
MSEGVEIGRSIGDPPVSIMCCCAMAPSTIRQARQGCPSQHRRPGAPRAPSSVARAMPAANITLVLFIGLEASRRFVSVLIAVFWAGLVADPCSRVPAV